MKKNLFIALVALYFLASCGPNAEQIEAVYLLIEQAEQQLKEANEQLNLARAQIEIEKAELSRVKEFQFMRTKSEKNKQIQAQSLKLQKAEENVPEWEDEVVRIEQKISELRKKLE